MYMKVTGRRDVWKVREREEGGSERMIDRLQET